MNTKKGKKIRHLYWILTLLIFFALISFLFIPQSHLFYVLSNARLEGTLAEKEYISNILTSLQEDTARRRHDLEDTRTDSEGVIKKIELRGQSAGYLPEEDKPFSAGSTMVTIIEQ